MNYLIVGLGAVGTVLSSCLNLEKDDKIYALRSTKTPKKIYDIELDVIENLKDKIKIYPNVVFEYDNEPIDIVFITTKSNYLDKVSLTFSKIKKHNPIVICLMNGMGYESYFKGFNTFYGVIMYNAFKRDTKVVLGSKGGLILDEKLEIYLKNRIKNLPLTFAKDIDAYRYRKLWLNTINGFLSILGFSLFQFFEESIKYDFKTFSIFIEYLEETKILFERLNIKSEALPSLDPETLISLMKKILLKEKLNETEQILYHNLPRGKNSTLQSIEKKESTEYEFIGGYLVNLADKIDFSYKINRYVYEKIKEYDKTYQFEFISLDKMLQIFS